MSALAQFPTPASATLIFPIYETTLDAATPMSSYYKSTKAADLGAIDTITVSDWLHDSSIKPKSLWNRRAVVRIFEKANQRSMDQIIADIASDKVSVYHACKQFMDFLRKNYASYTCYTYRSILPGLFESVLDESRFSKRKFDRIVPSGGFYISHIKKAPERSQVVEMLKITSPLYRALIGGLACGGFRIGEWLSRRMSDLEIRPEGYARVKLQAKDTKANYARFSFLTREIVGFIHAYRLSANVSDSEYVFPSGKAEHLSYNGARITIKPLFRKVGLCDTSDKSEVYTIHSFRTFASDEMRACGLREKDALAIIGHKYGAESSYIDWKRVESNWVATCADKMCFLDIGGIAEKHIVELTRTNGKLETLLERLLERMPPVTKSQSLKQKVEPNLNFTPLGAENNLYIDSDFLEGR